MEENNQSFIDKIFNVGTKVFEGLTDLESQRRELAVMKETERMRAEALAQRDNKYAGIQTQDLNPVSNMQTKEIVMYAAAGVLSLAGLFMIFRK